MEQSVLVDKWTGKDKEDRHTVLISYDLFFFFLKKICQFSWTTRQKVINCAYPKVAVKYISYNCCCNFKKLIERNIVDQEVLNHLLACACRACSKLGI